MLAGLRAVFGPNFVVENDTDAAALAEREHGHGREFASFVFVSIGTASAWAWCLADGCTGGAHGARGRSRSCRSPRVPAQSGAPDEVRRRGMLEAGGSSRDRQVGPRAGPMRAVRRGRCSRRRRRARARRRDRRRRGAPGRPGDLRDHHGVDPGLVVLGGGIGQAPGFVTAVGRRTRRDRAGTARIRVSALGTSAVVDGCLASGGELAWRRLTTQLGQSQPDQPEAPLFQLPLGRAVPAP